MMLTYPVILIGKNLKTSLTVQQVLHRHVLIAVKFNTVVKKLFVFVNERDWK